MAGIDEEKLQEFWQGQKPLWPQPGALYRHHRTGTRYVIVCVSLREDDLEPMVTYVNPEQGVYWTRPVVDFTWYVKAPEGEGMVRRFQLASP